LDRFLAALYEPWLLNPADIAIVKSSSSTIVFKSRDYIQKWHRTERGQDHRNISAKHLTPCNRPSDETRHSFEEHEIEDNSDGQEGANGTSSEAEVTVCTPKPKKVMGSQSDLNNKMSKLGDDNNPGHKVHLQNGNCPQPPSMMTRSISCKVSLLLNRHMFAMPLPDDGIRKVWRMMMSENNKRLYI